MQRYPWILLVVLIAGLVAAVLTLPVDEWLLDLVSWVRATGPAGVAVYAGV